MTPLPPPSASFPRPSIAPSAPPLPFASTLSAALRDAQDLVPSSHTTSVPFVKKEEYQCIDVDDEGFITVITPSGETRSDLKLPSEMSPEPPGALELSNKIKESLKDEKDFYVIVQCAIGHEQIMDIKMMTGGS